MFPSKQILPLAAASLLLALTGQIQAADHLDAPLLQQANKGDRDINDLYAFRSPSNPDNTVLILTVNPLAGRANPFFPSAMSGTTFGTDVTYEFNIDNNNDQVADVTYSTTFGPAVGGSQPFTVTGGASVVTGNTGLTTNLGGVSATAGLFDDPFFFDFVGFMDGTFDNGDTFAGFNVTAIVVEVPSSALGGPNLGIWARTVETGTGNQIDRMGRPGINTVLIDSSRKNDFNDGDPSTDVANFDVELRAAISGLGGDPNLAGTLLPDVLTIDTSIATQFLNGRALGDDVIDAALGLLTGGAIPSDNVPGNDFNGGVFPTAFPYLAPANQIPEPSTIALAVLGLSAVGFRRRSRG